MNPDDAKAAVATGFRYKGPEVNRPNEFVASLAGAETANVLYSGLAQGLASEARASLRERLHACTQAWVWQSVTVGHA